MSIVDEKPRPRALLLGIGSTERKTLESFFPTMRDIKNLDEVRQAEWDVIVARGADINPEPHMYVLMFGRNAVSLIKRERTELEERGAKAVYNNKSFASEFVIPDTLEPDLKRLVVTELLPRLRQENKHDCLNVERVGNAGPRFEEKLGQPERPWGLPFLLFVGTPESYALAGSFGRGGGKSQAWLLPFDNLAIAPWVEVALRQWHSKSPERFPVDFGWERAPAWMTPVEAELAGQIASIQKERRESLARFDFLERELAAKLHAENLAADAGDRRLLTAQDESLVQSVANAFREIGFEVQDMDAVWPVTDRREDLRLRLPEKPDWASICEVKGYYKGAKINDLMKVERFRSRFLKDEGREPDRCMYVVNSFINDSPASRKTPLPLNSEEVETFAEGGGLVVGTVELFRLLMDVRRGRTDAHKARSLLATATGVFSWVPKNEADDK